jgi:hypothetical protein
MNSLYGDVSRHLMNTNSDSNEDNAHSGCNFILFRTNFLKNLITQINLYFCEFIILPLALNFNTFPRASVPQMTILNYASICLVCPSCSLVLWLGSCQL